MSETHPLLIDGGDDAGAQRADAGGRSTSASRFVINNREYHPRQVVSAALMAAAFLAVAIGWFGVSGSSDVWEQIPFLISGGIGGALLMTLGLVVYLSYEHAEDRRCIVELTDRVEELELGLAGEFDALAERLDGAARPRIRARS